MRLAAVGSNCIDYYNNIDGGKAFPGGGPVNMAVYTLRLGGEAAYIGPVGDDVYGQIMIETIKAKGVDTSHLRVEKGKTAVTQVELIDGERVFGDYDEGVLEKYKLTDEDIDYIKNFDVVICDVWGKVEYESTHDSRDDAKVCHHATADGTFAGCGLCPRQHRR